MSARTSFFNPVRIIQGAGSVQDLKKWIGARRAVLLGTAGTLSRGLESTLMGAAGGFVAIHRGVQPNPTVASISKAIEELKSDAPQVIVAAGGGSTLDTAKGVAAALDPACDNPIQWLSDHLRKGAPFPKGFRSLPIIAIPTTSGTGSEVTPFATVWDEVDGAKYSLNHDGLFPEIALVDPELTVTMPRELTVFTGLDAFSHSLESLWNRNRSEESMALAIRSIRLLLESLPRAAQNGMDLESRRRVQDASVLGGMAIGSTKTALAHSMSYPLTSHLGVPHGLACSFSLGEVMKLHTSGVTSEVLDPICEALNVKTGSDAVERIYRFFGELELRGAVMRYIANSDQLLSVRGTLINPSRAANAFALVDDAGARQLLAQSWREVVGL